MLSIGKPALTIEDVIMLARQQKPVALPSSATALTREYSGASRVLLEWPVWRLHENIIPVIPYTNNGFCSPLMISGQDERPLQQALQSRVNRFDTLALFSSTILS